ncbi:glycosyltransferase family 4 protein [Curtobacterium caseinilyticum]|uniref:D-inositol 3-phosphate glycosyltransferase n=1 Tax=Curtobacterium caseinilyticum TaxID=3055137 RepID=A0ABT7TLU7_9MICO|nr:glycosyltransferase family 4 protein [Curtobacterium caseinilyticum]MDM7890553.1 glycosyltransferase family 4 protein [Curtobacterium caseinilyticum]
MTAGGRRGRPATVGVVDGPLRIAVVTGGLALTGGVERCVLEDTRELVAAGHDVSVWHRPSRPVPGPATDRTDPDLTGPAADRTDPDLAGVPDAPFRALGVTLHGVGDQRFGVRSALRDVVRFARDGVRLRRARPDVLWLNRPEHLPWGRVVSVLSGAPLVVHLHHAPNYRRVAPLAGGRTHFAAVSNTMARAWAEVGVPVDRISVVPNGVDPAAFPAASSTDRARARVRLGIAPDARTVLYYGRLTRSKGVLALLEAWQHLLDTVDARQPVASGTAVGGSGRSGGQYGADGSEAPDRSRHAAQDRPLLVLAGAMLPGEEDAVRRAVAALPDGAVLVLPERDDVVPLLHAADLVVAPSIEPEGYGRAVVEAMSAGVPVVAATAGGTGEILAGEWARFTVDPEDRPALAATVLAALDEAVDEPGLGERARAFVRDHHGRHRHVTALLRTLREHARR